MPWADRLHNSSGDGRDCDAQLRASRQPGCQLGWLIEVLRIAIDDLGVDSRHDVVTPRSGAMLLTRGMDLAVLLSARLARACLLSGWPARRLR